jgi:hypothetical protein
MAGIPCLMNSLIMSKVLSFVITVQWRFEGLSLDYIESFSHSLPIGPVGDVHLASQEGC